MNTEYNVGYTFIYEFQIKSLDKKIFTRLKTGEIKMFVKKLQTIMKNNVTRIQDTNSRRLTHLQLNRGATLCTKQVDVKKGRFIDVSASRIKPAFACFSKRLLKFVLLII